MTNLSKHIEYLLLTHDCVVIPGLGAFVARRVESRFCAEERLFLPPYRTVHFNPQIRRSDGLLENSLIEHYSVSLQEAKNMCSEFVDYINMQLIDGGTMDFGSIGIFSQDEVGIITFMPCQAGVTTPMLYGLDSFHAEKVQTVLLDKKKPKTFAIEDDKYITIRINRIAARYVAAVAASIVLFLSLSTPIANTSIPTPQDASSTDMFLPGNLRPSVQAIPLVDATDDTMEEGVLHIETKTSEVDTSDAEIASHESSQAEPQPVGGYAIVLASAVSDQNAANYVKSLHNRGIEAVVMKNDGMTRVLIPGFQTPDDVRQRIRELKAMDKCFSQAWMLNLSK